LLHQKFQNIAGERAKHHLSRQFIRRPIYKIVFAYDEHDSSAQQIDCLSYSEDIGLEILRRMSVDGDAAPCPIRINDINGIPIINETDRYAGIRFNFTMQNANPTKPNSNVWV
jgi:hypothetical protein